MENKINKKINLVYVYVNGDVKDSFKNFVTTFKQFTFSKRFVDTIWALKLAKSIRKSPSSICSGSLKYILDFILGEQIEGFERDVKNIESQKIIDTLRCMDCKEQDIVRFQEGWLRGYIT